MQDILRKRWFDGMTVGDILKSYTYLQGCSEAGGINDAEHISLGMVEKHECTLMRNGCRMEGASNG